MWSLHLAFRFLQLACLSVDGTETIEGTIGDIWGETTLELISLHEE